MATTKVHVATQGFRKLRRDLAAMAPGAEVEMTQIIAASVEPIAREARRRMPLGPGPQGPGDRLPHIRETIKGTARGARGAIHSNHPGAAVWEWGGTIAPRGAPIQIPRTRMVARAIATQKGKTEAALMAGMERLFRRHGWR